MEQRSDRQTSRRTQVLDAAADCFRQKGFHAASMAEIAKTAQMSVGHIYHYFKSKEDIICGIAERDIEQIRLRLEKHRQAQDIVKSMMEEVDEECTYCNRDDARMQIEVVAEAARNPKIGKELYANDKALRDELKSLIAKASGEHMVDARTDMLISIWCGMVYRTIEDPDLKLDSILPLAKAIMHQLLTDKLAIDDEAENAPAA